MKLEDTDKLETEGYANTMASLQKAGQSLPDYSGSYDGEIKSIYDKIVNRSPFSYDYNADPIYQNYRRDYQRQGKRAMADTMAQAADLTGGYASSYAQSLGQQQYGAYLEKLNQIMPELYSAAWQRYQAEGERLKARFNAASELAQSEYERNEDRADREFEMGKFDYQQMMDAYDNLTEAISTAGYSPSEEELQAAGMSPERAQALKLEYERRYLKKESTPSSGGGGGGGGGGSYSSSSSASKTKSSAASSLEKLKLAKNK